MFCFLITVLCKKNLTNTPKPNTNKPSTKKVKKFFSLSKSSISENPVLPQAANKMHKVTDVAFHTWTGP